MYRKFLVHYWWNGYTETVEVILKPRQKRNVETFAKLVRKQLELDKRGDMGFELRIYSWSEIDY